MRLFPSLNFGRHETASADNRVEDARTGFFEASFEAAGVGFLHADNTGRLLRANARAREWLGLVAGEGAQLDLDAVVAERDRERARATFEAILGGDEARLEGERVLRRADGREMTTWAVARRIGAPPTVLIALFDISERKAREVALRVSEERYRLAMQGVNEGLYDRRVAEGATYLSPRWKAMLGYSEDEITDDPEAWTKLVAPGVVETVNEHIRKLEAREIDTYELEFKMRHRDGRWLDILSRAFPVFDEDHRMVRLVGTHQDITERKRNEASMRLAETVFATTDEAILVADFSARIEAINPAFERLTGYKPEDVTGRNVSLLNSGRHDAAFFWRMHQDLAADGRWSGEIWNRGKNGSVRPYWATFTVLRDAEQQPCGYVALYADLSEYKRSQARLEYLAHHDADTALPNRVALRQRIESWFAENPLRRGAVALLHLDLDRYRAIVESLGHAVADELLVQFASRLQAKLGPKDTLARVGVDEFAILRTSCGSPEAGVKFARELIACLEAPFVFVSGAQAYCGAEIGVAWCDDADTGAESLMQQAASALYRARAEGGVRLFEPRHIVEARERLQLETSLRLALENEEFALQYQPLIDLTDERAIGVEALVRWRAPQGLVPPGRFIPLAETTGLIVPIGEWVLKRACAAFKGWLDAGVVLDTLAVNMSSRQFERPDVCETVARILAETGLAPERLELEITESVLMNQNDAVAKLHRLREQGIRVSVDDFGTGHSSLAYLKTLPIDKLKLDRAFLADVPSDPTGMAIAASMVRLGHSLDLKVLAEGVETRAQAEFLARSGCRQAQGYLFAKPMWEADLLAFLERDESVAA